MKSEGQQAVLSLHRVRSLLVRQKTQMTNAIRGLLREFGVVVGNGPTAALHIVKSCGDGEYPDVPDLSKGVLKTMCDQVTTLQEQVLLYDKLIDQHSQIDERVALVRTVPPLAHASLRFRAAGCWPDNRLNNRRDHR